MYQFKPHGPQVARDAGGPPLERLQAMAQGSKKCPLLVASDLRFMRCMGHQAAFALPSRNILAESRYQNAFDGACPGVAIPPGNWTCRSP